MSACLQAETSWPKTALINLSSSLKMTLLFVGLQINIQMWNLRRKCKSLQMTSNTKLLSFDGNRYGGLPKRFTRQNPRIVSIRGLFHRITTDRKRTSRLSPTSCLNISHLIRVSILNRQKRLEIK